MNKIQLQVPQNVDYINQWANFRNQLPQGHIILNKVYPGCGMTTYFLESQEPVILAAPRKKLLDNKADKMLREQKTYFYFHASTKKTKADRDAENLQLCNELREYLNNAYTPSGMVYVPKILVTFDSTPFLYGVLQGIGFSATLVVDEFHVVFIDYDMKRDVIERFFSVTQLIPNVIYLSATPIMENYLQQMDVFKNLPYVELVWPPSKIKTPLWVYKNMKSTPDAASFVIQQYKKNGVFDTVTVDGYTYSSREAVFFINDVRNIAQVIKQNGLLPSEVNILVAECSENQATLNKICGRGYTFGIIPLEGELHKTYTFCSKTVFFGCDFCSTNASTYVFADANLKNMCSDIALDLPQIAGRQRLEGVNHFKDKLTIFVKYASSSELTDYQQHKEHQRNNEMITDQICDAWKQLPQYALAPIKVDTNKCPYGVIYRDASKNDEWVVKKSVNAMVAEDRAWELRNCIYKDRQTFTYLMHSNGLNLQQQVILPSLLGTFYSNFMQCTDTAKQMKMFCDFFDCHPECLSEMNLLQNIPSEFKNYYTAFGTAFIAQKAYKLSRIKPEYDALVLREVIKQQVLNTFKVGMRYSRKDIKNKLQTIYDSVGLSGIKAKATQLHEWFQLAECVTIEDGTHIQAYQLLNIK